MAAVLHAVQRRNSYAVNLDGEEESGRERREQIRQQGRDEEEAARRERRRRKKEQERKRKAREAEEAAELDEQLSDAEDEDQEEEADGDAGAGAPPKGSCNPAARKDEGEGTASGAASGAASREERDRRVAEFFPQVAELDLAAKLDSRRLGEVKLKDVRRFYEVLGGGRSLSSLRRSVLLEVLTSSDAIRKPFSKSEASNLLQGAGGELCDPKVPPEQFHAMLAGGRGQSDGLSDLGDIADAEAAHGGQPDGRKTIDAHKTVVKRDDMLNILIATRDRHEDFALLPWTLFYIVVLVIAVNIHLRIFDRQLMESALEDWVNGRDPWTKASENVDDLRSYWEWAVDVGLPGVFGDPRETPAGWHFYMASRHVLVGDLSMTAERFDGSVEEAWLLNSEEGQKALRGNGPQAEPEAYLTAATTAAVALRDVHGWNSTEIETIGLTFITYNEFSKGYSIVTALARLNEFGTAIPVINADAYSIDQYVDLGAVWAICVDVVLILLNIRMGVTEAREMASCTRSWEEFKGYWNVWNIIDWSSVLTSVFACVVWLMCVVYMRDDTFRGHLDKQYMIEKNMLSFSPDQVQLVHKHMFRLRKWFQVLHVLVALCTVFVVLKFFKGFQSNPRLKVVTDTFQQASTDLAHFFIIFLTLFLPFTIIGHILFGNDIPKMGSVMSSMNAGVELLMGEFGWYSDVALAHIASTLPSGMPTIVLFIWFFVFNFMMVLVVLNMLLAVVLEHYTKITGELDGEPDEAKPPIWKQASRYWKFMRKTRRHIPIEELARRMEDPVDPAHKDEEVSRESLMHGFVGMGEEQAEFLMDFLQRHTLILQERQKRREEHANHQPQILHNVKNTRRELMELADKVGEPHPDLMLRVEQLLRLAKSVREDQKRLTQHVEKIASRLPEETRGKLRDEAARSARPRRGEA